MSVQNVELARMAAEAFDRRDRDAWLQTRHPDVEVVADRGWPDAGEVRGREAAWDFYLSVTEAFENLSIANDVEFVAAGDDGVLILHHAGVRGRSSGLEVSFDYCVITTVRDGVVVRDEWFAEHAEGRRAAGLPD